MGTELDGGGLTLSLKERRATVGSRFTVFSGSILQKRSIGDPV